MFDPSKLNLDIDENSQDKDIKKPDVIEKKEEILEKASNSSIDSKQEKIKEVKIEKNPETINQSSDNEDILGDLEIISPESSNDIFEKEDSSVSEKIENDSVLEDLKNPLTEEKPEKVQNKSNPEKTEIKEEENTENVIIEETKEITEKKEVIVDINITSLKDILYLLVDKEYDFVTIEPNETDAKIIFRKDSVAVDTRFIKYPTYSNIVINTKTLSKLDLVETKKTQEGLGEENVRGKNYKVITKTVPDNFGEKLFIKTTLQEKKAVKKVATKLTTTQILTFLGTLAAIALIVGGSFIGFIAMNAKTVEDVKFFYSLGINLNDINSFISQVVTIIFSILLLILSSFLIVYLFKFSLTKKEFKQKKIRFGIIATVFLIITFTTASVWMIIDKKIKNLPNWQELSYGEVQLFDNSKLVSDTFEKGGALIKDSSNLIGPVDINFDLSYYAKSEESKGFKIKKFTWDFGGSDIIETPIPVIIKTFDKKATTNVILTIQEVDLQGKVIEKVIENIPSINISYIVNVEEKTLSNGGKLVSFDASSLSEQGKLEWYFIDDLEKKAWEGVNYTISKPIFEETIIGMYIRRNDKTSEALDKIFIIKSQDKINIEAEIKHKRSLINDLEFEFSLDNISNDDGSGFIEKFKWYVGNVEYTKSGDIDDPTGASKIKHTFKEYGEKIIKVILTDSTGETKEFSTTISTKKQLKLSKKISISSDGKNVENVDYDPSLNEYFINEIGIPNKMKFDTRLVKANNTLYNLQKIEWDYNSDGDIDYSGRIGNYDINTEGNHKVTVHMTFSNRKIDSDSITITEYIFIEGLRKEAIIDFKINKSSNYVPITVGFDASKSVVKDSNIAKFVWDYGDGFTEERDAVVPGHKYTESGTYTVKLKVVTTDGRSFSSSKQLVLNKKAQTIDIKPSMKNAPIYQGIDFLSDKSEGQINTYFWKFGDGETSTEANPTHSYVKPGTYKVELRLDFDNKNILKDSAEITIYE